MTEADALYPAWVDSINEHFDAVVVPDPFLVKVYKNSGVKKPVFMIPIPVYMDEFLTKPVKTKPQNIFAFGISCTLSDNKNHEMVVDAFIAEFGNTPNIVLKVHTTGLNDHGIRLKEKLKLMKIKNVLLTIAPLPWLEYVEFMSSLDCYCLVSKGEGFSLTPREAMAAGIPCIVSNNTSHMTLCNSGLVYSVPADIKETHINGDRKCGNNFNCRIEDVRKALRDVYYNYQYYLKKAQLAREWVKQYHGNSLKPKYLNLFKPRKILWGHHDEVTDDYLVTTDVKLCRKYLALSKLS